MTQSYGVVMPAEADGLITGRWLHNVYTGIEAMWLNLFYSYDIVFIPSASAPPQLLDDIIGFTIPLAEGWLR